MNSYQMIFLLLYLLVAAIVMHFLLRSIQKKGHTVELDDAAQAFVFSVAWGFLFPVIVIVLVGNFIVYCYGPPKKPRHPPLDKK